MHTEFGRKRIHVGFRALRNSIFLYILCPCDAGNESCFCTPKSRRRSSLEVGTKFEYTLFTGRCMLSGRKRLTIARTVSSERKRDDGAINPEIEWLQMFRSREIAKVFPVSFSAQRSFSSSALFKVPFFCQHLNPISPSCRQRKLYYVRGKLFFPAFLRVKSQTSSFPTACSFQWDLVLHYARSG